MIITEIYIKNFGMLSDRHIRFTDDVQIIYGENESGKSTLHAFIRAMLFGMERGRGKAATKDDFTRYEPWGNPEKYAGVLVQLRRKTVPAGTEFQPLYEARFSDLRR